MTTAEDAGAARAAAAERHTEWSARADALALALDAARARAGAEHLSDVDGALGTLLDLVEIDPGWEAAAEAALGEALAAVVVTDAGAARRALDHLDQVDVGGGVLAAAGPPSAPAAATPGARVRDHVRAVDPTVDGLLDRLLQQAVVVAGPWADALDVALAHPSAVVVTRNGDRFSATGFRLGPGRRRGDGVRARRGPAPHGGGRDRARRDDGRPRRRHRRRRGGRRPSSRPPRRALEAHDVDSARAAATLERLQRRAPGGR